MLDTDTQGRIDSARDMLGGKVPLPQVAGRTVHNCTDLQVHER
jgi:hypothetical protein